MANRTARHTAATPSLIRRGSVRIAAAVQRTSRTSIALGRDRWIIGLNVLGPSRAGFRRPSWAHHSLVTTRDAESGSNLTWQLGRRPSATHARHWMDGRTRRRRRARDAAAPGGRLVPRDVAVGVDRAGRGRRPARSSTCWRRASDRTGIGSMPTRSGRSSAGDAARAPDLDRGRPCGHGPSARRRT